MDRALFDAVQTKLTEQCSHRTVARTQSATLLAGVLFDDAGHRMVATHATKNRVRYRYYISERLLRGPSKSPLRSISRVPASDIEGTIIKALAAHFDDPSQPKLLHFQIDRDTILAHVARIDVRKGQLAVHFKSPGMTESVDLDQGVERDPALLNKDRSDTLLLIPWRKPPSKASRAILLPATASVLQMRPIRAERRTDLIRSIARGRARLDEIIAGTTRMSQRLQSAKLQHPSCEQDDLDGLSRSSPRQGRPRRKPASRRRNR